jgi:hypothetical protein
MSIRNAVAALLMLAPMTGCDSYAVASCESRTKAAEEMVRAPVDTSCTADSDCVIAGTGTDCRRGCSRVVSRQGQTQLVDAQRRAAEGPCKGFAEAGCLQAGPSCQAPQGVVCSDGKCRESVPPASTKR